MPKIELPFRSSDISALARSLSGQLKAAERLPSHVELLNMLAKAAGFQNFQHFRAQTVAERQLAMSPGPEVTVDYVALKRLRRYFDRNGRLVRWPKKFSHQEPCLWTLWASLPARTTFTEREINDLLRENHHFGDPALLRREMKERNMVTRTRDGREYRRVERKPPPEALALIHQLSKPLNE